MNKLGILFLNKHNEKYQSKLYKCKRKKKFSISAPHNRKYAISNIWVVPSEGMEQVANYSISGGSDITTKYMILSI